MESSVFAGSLQLLSCVLLVSALLYSGYKARCRSLERAKFLKTHKCQSTGPSYPGIPFLFGLDFLLENVRNVIKHKFAQGVHERFQRYGPTHRSRIVLKGIVNTIEPENLEAVFKHQFTDYAIIPGRAKLVKAFFGDGIFSNSGHEWKESKSLVHMAMANTRLDEALFEKHASRLIQSIRSQESAAFDFAELAFAYTLDVSTGVFFGESTGALVDQEIDMELRQFGRDFSMLGKMARVLTIFNNQFPFLRRIMFWGEYKPTQSRINSFVDGRVQRASSSKQHQEVLQVRELQDMKIPSARGTVVEALALRTPDGLRARKEALNLLLAARDTVGIALSETFYWLARKPAVWAKLRKEIKEVLGDRTPTFAELKKMGYLKHILYEALRLQPTLSVHGRLATRDTVLPRGGGTNGREPLFVSKGTYLLYSLYALHIDPKVFGADILEFRPERWETITPSKYEYLDFGTGPRQCPGKQMGWSMVAYAVVRLAQEFREIQPRDDRPWEEARAFSFFNRHGVHVAMTD